MFTINSAEAGEQPNGRFSRSAYWVLTLFFGITGLVNGLFYHVLITDLFAYLVIMVNVFASVLVILSCFGKNPLFIRESREPADEQHACYLFPFPPHNLMPEARTDAYDNGRDGFSIKAVQKKPVEKEDRLLREAAEYARTFLN